MTITIPTELMESAKLLLDWGCNKLSANEGFSVLMMLHRTDGKHGGKYCFDTIEEAFAEARRDIGENRQRRPAMFTATMSRSMPTPIPSAVSYSR
jgi:hypothetical protein